MLRWLQGVGMMRRAKEPDEPVIVELFAQSANRFQCPSCGHTGLAVEEAVDDGSDDAWGMARRCARCRQSIPPERLEIFPNATLCAPCQSSSEAESDPHADTPEYCPRCGSIMTLRAVRTSGVQRYRLCCLPPHGCGYTE